MTRIRGREKRIRMRGRERENCFYKTISSLLLLFSNKIDCQQWAISFFLSFTLSVKSKNEREREREKVAVHLRSLSCSWNEVPWKIIERHPPVCNAKVKPKAKLELELLQHQHQRNSDINNEDQITNRYF